jgi:hypothetical protein
MASVKLVGGLEMPAIESNYGLGAIPDRGREHVPVFRVVVQASLQIL